MAKSKKSDSVKVRNGALEREFPKAQWDQMVANKETYGWTNASDLPKDLKDKEAQIELSKIAELEKDLKSSNEKATGLEDQVKTLTSDNEAKDAKIAELEKSLAAATKTDSKKK